MIIIKKSAARIIAYTNFLQKLIENKSKQGFLILMYHRIMPFQESDPKRQKYMYVEPDTFNLHIEYLKNYFSIKTLSEIINHRDEKIDTKREPTCVLTFDDGFHDFYKYAFPILKDHKVPATIFLTTKFIGTDNLLWTDILSHIIMDKHKNNVTVGKIKNMKNIYVNMIKNLKGSVQDQIEEAIDICKNLNEEDIFRVLEDLRETWGVSTYPLERDFLSWEEVIEMGATGIVTYGSHSESHRNLTNLKSNEVRDELIKSKNMLIEKGVVNSSFIPFCYPYGRYNNIVSILVRESGYNIALTTNEGWNNINEIDFNLNRIGIFQDISSTKELFGCRIAGVF